MSESLCIVDAFAERPFAGNPAAVCLLKAERDAAWMQRVAAEMNLSETAFLLPLVAGRWSLRWFTPTVEVDLCGHATLAAAHVLWTEHGETVPELAFETRSGRLGAVREDGRIGLDFPADPPRPADLPPGLAPGLAQALGCEPATVARGRHDLMVVLPDGADLRQLTPDLARLAELPVRGVMVTCAGQASEYDFESRFFAPQSGIPEDPVTGSAHCVLGPYWGVRLGRSTLRA